MESLAVKGYLSTGVAAGIKSVDRLDMAMVASLEPANWAAVFTTNQFPAAPVLLGRELQGRVGSAAAENGGRLSGVIINSGCANACTGEEGLKNARRMSEAAAREFVKAHPNCQVAEFLPMSTGVIGVQLPIEKIEKGANLAAAGLHSSGWELAAQAIMTTDTKPKLAASKFNLTGALEGSLLGIAKGAGMIHPNMATMLGVIVTDLRISNAALQQSLRIAADQSFNRISVDGDTSTNDTVLVLANGALGNDEILEAKGEHFERFTEALCKVSLQLAQAIVRDGEGATKFVTVLVSGANSSEEAQRVAETIATSPLVKTAIYGEDANWGRILAAAGRAGVALSPQSCSLAIYAGTEEQPGSCRLELVRAGEPTDYSEPEAKKIFSAAEIVIDLRIGLGASSTKFWTTDLSHEYVSVNGSYRS